MSRISIAERKLPLGQVFDRLRPIKAILKHNGRILYGVSIASVLAQSCGICSAISGAYLVGRLVTGTPLGEAWGLIGIFIGFTLGQFVLLNLNSYWAHIMSFRALGSLRKTLYNKFDELAPSYFVERRSGDVARVALSDVSLLELYTAHTLPEFLQAIVVTPLVLILMGFFHWSLMLVLLPFLITAATVPDWLSRKAAEHGQQLRIAAGEMSAETVDSVQGLREIIAFGAQKRARDRFDCCQLSYADSFVSYERRSGFEHAVSDALLSLGIIVVVALGAWLVVSHQMDAAYFPAVTVLAAFTFVPVMQLTAIARQLSQVGAAADRVFSILNAKPSVTDLVTQSPLGPLLPEIRFDNVNFSYGPDMSEVLHSVDFTVAPGETVALVGHSGAGKSTCTYLLLRLWDPVSGSIRIGGHDIRAFPQDELRKLIAYVPQDVYLFNTSVRENIRIGRADATDTEVEKAAIRAFALDFIEALPDKWETVLGERGATLSGGQRQRIAIARALLKNAPILVMDEAVSSLDTESEVSVRNAMAEATAGRTTLIVAHRPSTIRTADRIVVLDSGRIVESGAFESLVKSNRSFSQLIAVKVDRPFE